MRILLPFLFACLVIITSCKNTPAESKEPTVENLYGTWSLQDVSAKTKSSATGTDKLLQEAQNKELLKTGLLISLFEDGTYTEVSSDGGYTAGQWRKEPVGDVIRIGDKLQAKMEQRGKQAILIVNNARQKMELEFVKTAKPLADFKQDPFYPANNSWRKTTPDSAAAIHQKLTNYFGHLACILKAAKERESQTISFEYSQGIVKIYNGGIGILPLHQVDKTWTARFETEQGAATAYWMFERYLEQSPSYKGASKGDWVEDDYNILLSIYGDFERKKIFGGGVRKQEN